MTVRCVRAFLGRYVTTGDRESLSVARETVQSIRTEWNRSNVDGRAAIGLTPDGERITLAGNALAAGLFARVADLTNEPELLAGATDLARLVAGEQRTGGSWPCGRAVGRCPRDCDAVRTGVLLDGLGEYLRYTYDSTVQAAYVKGLERYQVESGHPLATHWMARRYGAHAIGQALLTTARNGGPSDMEKARTAASRAIDRLTDDGRYRPTREGTAHRCGGQAWLCRGLAAVLARDHGRVSATHR